MSFSVSFLLMMAPMAPVPSSMTTLSLRSITPSTIPWVVHAPLSMERLHWGHLLMIPLPWRTSTTRPSNVMSSPPPILVISSTVFMLADVSTTSVTSSTRLTSHLSPRLSWGMPFHDLM